MDGLISIGPFSKNHVDMAAALEQEVFSDEPWSLSSFEAELSSPFSLSFSAMYGEVLAGYIMGECVYGAGRINNLAVSKPHRGKGIGESLVREFLSHAKEQSAESVTLEVRKSNIPAISLYSKLGFSVVSERKRFYRNPTEDALLMYIKIQENM